MRENTKIVTVPVGEEKKEVRIEKLDAFSGVALIRRLAERLNDPGVNSYGTLLLSLEEEEMVRIMQTCLSHAEMHLPAGYTRVWTKECWGIPELEYDPKACLELTLHVMSFTLDGFFPEDELTSGPGEEATFR